MGTTIALCLVIPMVLGWLIDRWAGTLPAFVLVGLVLGIASAGWYAYSQARKIFGSGHE